MRNHDHFLLLTWVLTISLVLVGTVIALDQGLVGSFLENDRSRICLVLIAMYFVGIGHSFLRTVYLSRELNRAGAIERLLAGATQLRLEAGEIVTGSGYRLPPGFVATYLRDVLRAKGPEARPVESEREKGDDLLEAYAAGLRGRHEFGWFMIDLMLKVGFLGTLIGFIWMLASVSENTVVDASTMQSILKQMSFGMSTALNTTLASLVTGTLLSIPYYLLGRGLDELLESTIRITQVEVLPRLANA